MFYELPALKFEIYTDVDGTRVKLKNFCKTIHTYSPVLASDISVSVPVDNIPESFYIYITPIFDNESIASRNMLIYNGIESGDLWETLTNDFSVSVDFEAVESGGGGGGSDFPEDCPFICDKDKFIDSAVQVMLLDRIFYKTTSEYSIGAIVTLNGMSGPIFISPINTSTSSQYTFTYQGTTYVSPKLGPVEYDGLDWYYSDAYGYMSGTLSDSYGNVKNYDSAITGSITSQDIINILKWANVSKK